MDLPKIRDLREVALFLLIDAAQSVPGIPWLAA